MKWRSPSSSVKGAPLALITQGAIVTAVYLVLTVATSFMSFTVIQLRLAEALTALPALFPSAIPGVFLGCLLANLLNPTPLGMVDVILGSLVTLVSAVLTWRLAKPWRRQLAQEVLGDTQKQDSRFKKMGRTILPLLPPIGLNALVVGSYLPYLIQPDHPPPSLIAASIASIFISQSLVLFVAGLPLITALRKTPWAKRNYLVEWERERAPKEEA